MMFQLGDEVAYMTTTCTVRKDTCTPFECTCADKVGRSADSGQLWSAMGLVVLIVACIF